MNLKELYNLNGRIWKKVFSSPKHFLYYVTVKLFLVWIVVSCNVTAILAAIAYGQNEAAFNSNLPSWAQPIAIAMVYTVGYGSTVLVVVFVISIFAGLFFVVRGD